MLELNSDQAEMIAELKGHLNTAKRHRGRLLSQLRAVEENMSACNPNLQRDFEKLKHFFPNADIAKFSEIENFHAQLASVLSHEYIETKNRLTELLALADAEIQRLENEMKECGLPIKVSRPMLDIYSSVAAQIARLEEQKR